MCYSRFEMYFAQLHRFVCLIVEVQSNRIDGLTFSVIKLTEQKYNAGTHVCKLGVLDVKHVVLVEQGLLIIAQLLHKSHHMVLDLS